MDLTIEPDVDVALQIARANGYTKEGYYLNDGSITVPLYRTREFASYFFKMKVLEDLYMKSDNPRKLLREYIEVEYPDWNKKHGFKWLTCL